MSHPKRFAKRINHFLHDLCEVSAKKSKETQQSMNQTLIFTSFLTPTRYKMCLYITEYVECVLGVPTFLLNGESFEDFATADADAGLLSPLAYMQLLHEPSSPVELIAAPVLQGADSLDTPPDLVDIVVRRESPLHSESDLADCTWAHYWSYSPGPSRIEDPLTCAQNMLSVSFHETIEASSPAQALRMVLDGRADATAIDARLLALVRRNSPLMDEQLRTLNTCYHTPGPLIVVAKHVHPLLTRQIQTALVSMHEHPLLEQKLHESNIERFVAMTDDCYSIRQPHDWDMEPVATSTEPPVSLRVPAGV
jgi:ABC-type phosphate/phosphonate transport system substrate-binding protein